MNAADQCVQHNNSQFIQQQYTVATQQVSTCMQSAVLLQLAQVSMTTEGKATPLHQSLQHMASECVNVNSAGNPDVV